MLVQRSVHPDIRRGGATIRAMSIGTGIDAEGHIPIYLQVAQQLRQEIAGGMFEVGHMLPGELSLMARYGISRDSARKAIAVLKGEGLVAARRGTGTFVAHVPEPIPVTVHPGDEIRTRMPAPAERQQLGVAEGVPVLEVKRAAGGTEVYDGNRARVKITPLELGAPPVTLGVPG